MASEISIAVRGDQIQRGSRQRRAALSGYGEDFRRLRSARDDPTTALTIVKTGPRLKEDGVGRGPNALKDCREDVSEAHLFPGPDRVQQDASSNRLPGFADDASQREPSLVSEFVADHTDVERVILRARPVSPLQEYGRSVSGNSVYGPVTARQLRELLPVPTRLDGQFRRLPCEKLQDWIGTPTNDTRESCRQRTRSPSGKKKREHDFEFERKNVLRVGIRNGAGAELRPHRAGISVTRRGKEDGVAWGIQIPLEQVESQRPGVWLYEEAARTKAEKPLVSRQEHGGEREKESRDDARRIANTQAVGRAGDSERIPYEKPLQPLETPFNAQRIVRALNGRTLIPAGMPAVEEARHVAQCSIEDWLDLKLLSVFLARAKERSGLHPCAPLSTRPRLSRRSFCAHRYKSQLR